MAELTFKSFNDLDIKEVLNDASHVIIEENGDVKRFPASSIGKVKTINGVEPDESGNVAIDIPEGFSGSWNDLTDKPFGETFTNKVLFEGSVTEDTSFLLGVEMIEGNTYHVIIDGEEYERVCKHIVNTVYYVDQYLIGNPNAYNRNLEDTGEPFALIQINDTNWCAYFKSSPSTREITIQTNGVDVQCLDETYIPDVIARTDHTHSWNDLTNKPFGEEMTKSQEIFNGNVQTSTLYNVGAKLVDGKTYCVVFDGIEYIYVCQQSETASYEYYIGSNNNYPFKIVYSLAVSGKWSFYWEDSQTTTRDIIVYEMSSNVMPLDSKFLPKAAAIADLTEAPTAAEFNALLAALRNAGLMATE